MAIFDVIRDKKIATLADALMLMARITYCESKFLEALLPSRTSAGRDSAIAAIAAVVRTFRVAGIKPDMIEPRLWHNCQRVPKGLSCE